MRRRLALALLAAVFFATRLYNLTLLPIFVDESINVCWAARWAREPGFWKPWEDGKLLHILVTSLLVPRAADPLWAGRCAAAVTGCLGMLAAWGLGRRLFDARAGFSAAALYLVCPFTLFYDRMDLADVYLSSCAVLALLATADLLARPTLRRGTALGVALAACVLAKAPGLIVLAFPAAGAVLLGPRRPGARRALALAYGLCLLIVAGPVLYFLSHSTQVQAKTGKAGGDRLGLLVENTRRAVGWLWSYWTPPVCVAGVAAAAAGLVRHRGAEALLLVAATLPAVVFSLTAHDWFPRYVLFASIPFLVLAARALVAASDWAAGRWPEAHRLRLMASVLAIMALLAPAARFDYWILADPAQAPLPEVEGFQYVWGWPSGYGWSQAVQILRAERARHPEGITLLGDSLGHGVGSWAVRASFINDPGVEVVVFDAESPAAIELMDERAATRPVFCLTSKREYFQGTRALKPKRIAVLHKPSRRFAGQLYRLRPRSATASTP